MELKPFRFALLTTGQVVFVLAVNYNDKIVHAVNLESQTLRMKNYEFCKVSNVPVAEKNVCGSLRESYRDSRYHPTRVTNQRKKQIQLALRHLAVASIV